MTASAQGFSSVPSSLVTVNQPAITGLSAGSVAAGMHRGGFGISLNSPAPAGGLLVNLASTDSTIATVPQSVTIPEGYTYLPSGFTVTGQSTGGLASQTVQITASAQNWTGTTAQITVANPVLNLRNVQSPRTTASASRSED